MATHYGFVRSRVCFWLVLLFFSGWFIDLDGGQTIGNDRGYQSSSNSLSKGRCEHCTTVVYKYRTLHQSRMLQIKEGVWHHLH